MVKDENIKKFLVDESSKISFQLIYWGLVAAIIILPISQGWINEKTVIPDSALNYIEERLSYKVMIFELVPLFLMATITALAGGYRYIQLIREEIARILYTFGAVLGCGIAVFAFATSNNAIYTVSFVAWVAFTAIGIIFLYLTTEDKSETINT